MLNSTSIFRSPLRSEHAGILEAGEGAGGKVVWTESRDVTRRESLVREEGVEIDGDLGRANRTEAGASVNQRRQHTHTVHLRYDVEVGVALRDPVHRSILFAYLLFEAHERLVDLVECRLELVREQFPRLPPKAFRVALRQ
jgi:hypothetical protein